MTKYEVNPMEVYDTMCDDDKLEMKLKKLLKSPEYKTSGNFFR